MNTKLTPTHEPSARTGSSKGLRQRRSSLASLLLAAASFFTLAFGTALAAPLALINGDTVTGGAGSQEAQAATTQGYVVTVVTNATWQGMTQAQFGTYDLLIIGDQTCSGASQNAATNSAVWAPVVMGTAGGRTSAGNRIVIGTDPVFHDGGVNTLRGTIIRTGIRFAGKQPGRTGLYFCASCSSSSAAILTALGQLSTGTGTWTVNGGPPCGGSVSLIATEPAFVTPDLLTTASLQGWGCSVHESWPTFKSDWSALAVATDTPTKPTCGVDPNTGLSACGQAYILIAGSSIVVTSGSISISPLDATNPVGTSHTVTAHVSDSVSHAPLAGKAVTFTITGVNVGVPGVCTPADCKTDANGDVSFTYPDTNGVGDDTIKASFTDATGALQSATAQKHWIITNHPPVAKCKNVTVPAAAFPNCKAFASVDNGSFDPDPADTITITQVPAGPYPLGTTTVTLTVTDNNGASDTCTATVTVVDNSFPIVSGCPGDITVFTGPGSTTCSQVATWTEPLAASCTLVSFVGNHKPGDTFPGGPTTVTYTATDAAGHTNSCSFTVTVVDNTVPVLSGQGGPLTLECPAPAVFTAPTATDNCDPTPAITFADVTTAGTCPGAYTVTRTWTAKDASGNVSLPVSQTITVADTTPPTLAGQGANMTIECPAVPVFTAPTARDNCDPNPTVGFSDATTPGTCPGTYSVTRTWKATDCSGLVSAPVSQTITVVDTTTPTLAGQGANRTIECPAVPVFTAPTARDNCDPNPTVGFSDATTAGSCPGSYSVTRTWTATDCGGLVSAPVSQTITVVDTTPPALAGQGANVTIECPAVPVFTAPSATDKCDPSPAITFADVTTAGSCPGAYSVTRTWKATDCSGNVSASVSQTITVADTTPPTLAGQGANMTIECPAAPVFTAPTAKDSCDPNPTIAFTDATTAGACHGTYSVTRTWKATDCSGLVSAPVSQTITVVDTTPPVVACPPNVSVAFGAVPAAATTKAGFLAQGGTITDNCDPNPTVTSSDVTVGICPIVVTRTYTVTDCSGNKSTCKQTITVNNLFAADGILWHQPLARNGASEDTDPSAGNTLKYGFKLGSTIPIQIHAQGCGGDVTTNSNVTGKVVVYGDTNKDGLIGAGDLPVTIGYNGVGGAGGVMDKIGPHLKYNLDTKKLPSTFTCFILQVTITDTATGESRVETVPLQAK